MTPVQIGQHSLGEGPCYVIAEIGINHNGDVGVAKQLIDVAKAAGCNAVKFQKRTPELCVPEAQRDMPRETPWGIMSYMEYRRKVEFGREEYEEIDRHCKESGISWFASCWDDESVGFIRDFDTPCFKIASACLTDLELLTHTRAAGKPIMLSTGMSTLEQIDIAVETLGTEDLVILHACSAYPARYQDLNLRAMDTLRKRYDVPIGYSGHETGLPSTVAAAALGASVVERHVTMDRSMWGSDQAASLEPNGITRLVRDIRLVESALGDGVKRIVASEEPLIKRLRRVNA
jgi:N-acetylneuraminate synthase